MNPYDVAAIWLGMALLASLLSTRIALPVALLEILVGAFAGNLPGLKEHVLQTSPVIFLASLGSLALTFLAGAEIDPVSLRRHWASSLCIGAVSFAAPFLAAFAFCSWGLHWHLHAAEIGAIALSDASPAVIYVVLLETGLNREDIGKVILASCFVTGMGTLGALAGVFANYGWLLLVFVLVSAAVLTVLPRVLRTLVARVGTRISEPEMKLLLVVLLALGGLATQASSQAVLPAYVAGLVLAGVFVENRVLLDRLRTISFALLTPFFFLRTGTLISAPVLVSGAGVIAALLGVKLAAKMIGVWPTARAFGIPRRERNYTTLLMATGLTLGSIAALFGLTHHLVSQNQYTEVLTAVLLSALVPTVIAQLLFQPDVVDAEKEEALGAEGASIIHRRRSTPAAQPLGRPGTEASDLS